MICAIRKIKKSDQHTDHQAIMCRPTLKGFHGPVWFYSLELNSLNLLVLSQITVQNVLGEVPGRAGENAEPSVCWFHRFLLVSPPFSMRRSLRLGVHILSCWGSWPWRWWTLIHSKSHEYACNVGHQSSQINFPLQKKQQHKSIAALLCCNHLEKFLQK